MNVALIVSAPTAIGVVTGAVIQTWPVVPEWVMVIVAVPPPQLPQSYVAVAEPGETAAEAVGAKASDAAASPAATAPAAPKLLLLMVGSYPFPMDAGVRALRGMTEI
ncbi:hypothetical protein GCM10017667_36180 [Streptomyces filamentosus]|uniref:Uncharacterized protein n=1 Tax=Streptomyces filamentosus TaxID=67294 RepID=A0A919BMD3_STRFL|nr:hypothetical protein GCM10017667_36180 [Streptomyces filamentosus]